MREFKIDPEPVRFKIKSIEDGRVKITSLANAGSIEFTFFGKPVSPADIKSKHDLSITFLKFIALDAQKDYRIAAMKNFIGNDEMADILIACIHAHTNSQITEEEKHAAVVTLISAVNSYYNVFVKEQKDRENNRKGNRSDSRSRSDDKNNRRSESRFKNTPAGSSSVKNENTDSSEQNNAVISSRKQRISRPAPQKKSDKPKPVRVRTVKPKRS